MKYAALRYTLLVVAAGHGVLGTTDAPPVVNGTAQGYCVSLSRMLGEEQALAGVSFDLPEQRALAIVGPSGSGKTTLIRAMVHLIEPRNAGALTRLPHGTPIEVTGAFDLGGRFVAVQRFRQTPVWHRTPDDALLYSRRFGLGNVVTVFRRKGDPQSDLFERRILGNAGVRRELTKFVLARSEGSDLLARYKAKPGDSIILNRDGKELDRITQLSGPTQYRQRLAVASALLREPEPLILDEPTSALDTKKPFTATIVGSNVCLRCLLVKKAGMRATCRSASHKNGVFIIDATGEDGASIPELRGTTFHYLANKASQAMLGANTNESVSFRAKVFPRERVLKALALVTIVRNVVRDPRWFAELAKALTAAKQLRKNILVYFPDSTKENTVFEDPTVKRALLDLLLVKIPAGRKEDTVRGAPGTAVLLTRNGNELRRLPAILDTKALHDFLQLKKNRRTTGASNAGTAKEVSAPAVPVDASDKPKAASVGPTDKK